MSRVFSTPAELLDAVGEHLGASEWLEIDQERINQFADATGDHQWIHTDPERAKDRQGKGDPACPCINPWPDRSSCRKEPGPSRGS